MGRRTLVFIPTYNERDNVRAMCEQVVALGLDADLVFLDDDSPDGTGALLDELARAHPRVSVIHRTGTRGIGGAHLDGIAYAYQHGYGTLVTLDCDFTHAPADIPRLLAASEGADLVVGSRFLEPDSLPGWSPVRRFLTEFGHVLTKTLLDLHGDASGAFRVYRLDHIPQALFGLVRARGYAFFFESLFVAHKNGVHIRDVPIVLPARTYGSSKMSTLEVQRSVKQLLRLFAEERADPSRFRLPERAVEVNPALRDDAGWNAYWESKGKASGALYDVVAATYRNLVIKRALDRAIHDTFAAGSHLLHAGCGSGQVDLDVHAHARVTALDISVPALDLYQRNNPNAFAVKHGSLFALPFAEDTFDGAYNLGVVEHFNDEELTRALREIGRVVKRGGRLLIFWPHRRASSVMVLGATHWVMRNLLADESRLHPPEVSLVRSADHARGMLAAGGFELESYEFGPRDMFVQARVVAVNARR